MSNYPPYHSLYVMRELRRIGVDLERLGGFATSGGPPPAEFLRQLRTIPGGLGHDSSLALLESWESAGAPGPEVPEAPDVASFTDPELDELLAYCIEFDRVVPPDTVKNLDVGYDWPSGGRGHALRILRGLPDGAGLDSYLVLLRSPSPEPGAQ